MTPGGSAGHDDRQRGWQKAIPFARDRLQSRALTALVTILLLLGVVHLLLEDLRGDSRAPGALVLPVVLSLVFAGIVWRLRAATPPAALVGALICLLLAHPPQAPVLSRVPSSTVARGIGVAPVFAALITFFALTFLATRFRRSQKEGMGVAEARSGRRASQIVANLGVAGLCAAIGFYPGALAALAEATADTVSSEIGQALGGEAMLITSLRQVPPGTDGGISAVGTLAGLLAAALVVATGMRTGSLASDAIAFAAGAGGLLFDSLLGATVERRGWLGNDLVNFTSTLFAALLMGLAGNL